MPSTSFPSERLSLAAERAGARGSRRRSRSLWGTPGVRDEGLLDSALARPFASFGGNEAFPDDISKACALCHAIISSHPFVDGNKRAGAAVLGMTLRANGVQFSRTIARGSYRHSRFLVKRSPSYRVLRGNRRASVPTVGNSGAARCPLYRRSRFPAQPCHGVQMSRMAHASRRQQLTE